MYRISSFARRFQTSPDFKGIKTPFGAIRGRHYRSFKPALISKGLRRLSLVLHVFRRRFQTSPDFKGIKTDLWSVYERFAEFQTSPDFKGIKTPRVALRWCTYSFQTSPDFKGIKTPKIGPHKLI